MNDENILQDLENDSEHSESPNEDITFSNDNQQEILEELKAIREIFEQLLEDQNEEIEDIETETLEEIEDPILLELENLRADINFGIWAIIITFVIAEGLKLFFQQILKW